MISTKVLLLWNAICKGQKQHKIHIYPVLLVFCNCRGPNIHIIKTTKTSTPSMRALVKMSIWKIALSSYFWKTWSNNQNFGTLLEGSKIQQPELWNLVWKVERWKCWGLCPHTAASTGPGYTCLRRQRQVRVPMLHKLECHCSRFRSHVIFAGGSKW